MKIKPEFSISSLRQGTALSDLMHQAGHDIGNPLTSIISLASLIERAAEDGINVGGMQNGKRFSGSIVADAWKIQSITERLVLILSDRGREAAPLAPIPSIQEALRRTLKKSAYKEFDVIFRPGVETSSVLMDRSQFEWLISELIQNSLNHLSSAKDKSSPPNSPTINIHEDKADLIFTISNTLLEKIDLECQTLFEPFVRFPIFAKSVGLGLTAAYAVVDRVGGRISLEIWDGDGKENEFTVEVRLPKCDLKNVKT